MEPRRSEQTAQRCTRRRPELNQCLGRQVALSYRSGTKLLEQRIDRSVAHRFIILHIERGLKRSASYHHAPTPPLHRPPLDVFSSSVMMRRRLLYMALAALTIGAGLLSRHVLHTPRWLAKGVGDALYATLWFWLCGLLFPQRSAAVRATLATAICFVVELSQLYHTPWLDSLRATRLGYLVLGRGFHIEDLAFYVCGVLLGVAAERLGARRLIR